MHFYPEAERGWLEDTFSELNRDSETVIVGPGRDDCGVVRLPEGRFLVATGDFVNSRPLVLTLGIGDEADVGHLAVAASLSDLLGSGAKPIALLLHVAMPSEAGQESYRRVVSGAGHEAAKWRVPIIGGDSKVSDCLSVNVAAFGVVEDLDQLFLADRAAVGHDIWISGPIGDVNAAVLLLRGDHPEESTRNAAIRAIRRPRLPYEQSRQLSSQGLRAAGTDLSDGLVFNLRRVCELSGVGATIELSRLPLSPFAVEAMASLGLPSYACALGLGGDLQFLVTADRSQRAAFEDAGMYRVGTITDGRDVLAMHDDRRLSNLSRLGHEDGTTTSLVEEAGAVFEPFGD